MTGSSVESVGLRDDALFAWSALNPRARNWPVVYTLTGGRSVYVGESLNMLKRAQQHRANPERAELDTAHVIIDDTFNKSVCLDLESHLIRWLSGDGAKAVQNRNDGIVDADYYGRAEYRAAFQGVFEELRAKGIFTRSIQQIENSNLFKLSPFKALTDDQAGAIENILDGLYADLERGVETTSVVQGDPGTGKTVLGIYLVKLLVDIATRPRDEFDPDSRFADFFTDGHSDLIDPARIAIVIPQQSLRASVKSVFATTPGLSAAMVLSPFDLVKIDGQFDLILVDEAHRLNQRAQQANGVLYKRFGEINVALFGRDDPERTQLDWVVAKSKHRILLLDSKQAVRPADLPLETTRDLVDRADACGRRYRLLSQMRVRADDDYVGYVRGMLGGGAVTPRAFDGYDLRFYDDVGAMRDAILARDAEVGLSRLVSGYAWPWRSRADATAFDIAIGDHRFRWNGTATDWISSPGSEHEVGSIHTVQGYDLNYAGVIIGPDLALDAATGRIVFRREHYFDRRGRANNLARGITYSDDDILEFVVNIYTVLMTRGMRGTYVYVDDPALRERLRPYLVASSG